MNSLQDYVAWAKDDEKKKRLKDQWSTAHKNQIIQCGCGVIRHVMIAYRCLYCGEWFCMNCAEVHFGKTIKCWREEHESKKQHGNDDKK